MNAVEQQIAIPTATTERLWGVTTLLNMALGAGPGLVYWHCEQTATICLDRRSTLDTMKRDEAIKWAVDKRWEATERAKARGTEVHRAAEAIALGAPTPLIEPDMAREIAPYVEQLVRWLKTYQPTFVMAEAPIYNLTHGYAGTCDGIFEIGGQRYIFDYKTTEKGPDARSRPPYSNASLQMSAYAHAEQVGLLADRRFAEQQKDRWYIYDPAVEHQPMPPVDKALCIVVSPVDCFAQHVAIGEIPFQSFLHAKALAEWNRDLFKQAFGTTWVAKAS